MKNFVFILGMLSILLVSCDKVEKISDDISFRKYIPHLILNPADSVAKKYAPHCSETIPFPSDSTQSVTIDVDKDGLNDFKFTYSTNYNFVSIVDSCQNHNSRITVEGIGTDNMIVTDEENPENIRVLAFNDEIKITNSFADKATIFLNDASFPNDVILESGNKYFGVKLKSNTVGWIKVYHDNGDMKFAILEHAFNHTFQLSIKAGQTE